MDKSAALFALVLIVSSLSLIMVQGADVACDDYLFCDDCNIYSDDCMWGQCENVDVDVGTTEICANKTDDLIVEECNTFTPVTCDITEPTDAPTVTNSTIQETPNPTNASAEVTDAPAVGTTQESTDNYLSTEAPEGGFLPVTGASFDAASFVGGIILCGGIVLITFIGCKFYQSRTKNYTTL